MSDYRIIKFTEMPGSFTQRNKEMGVLEMVPGHRHSETDFTPLDFGEGIVAEEISGKLVLKSTGVSGEGTQGPPGEQGPPGTPGYTPVKGVDYFDGESGSQGTQGIPGEAGPKGDKGDQGNPGAKGDKGDPGSSGTPGDKGDTGAQGPKGDAGDTGGVGPQGPKGDTGDAGSPGLKGDTGNPGSQGEQGIQGIKGDKGDKGDTGGLGYTLHVQALTSSPGDGATVYFGQQPRAPGAVGLSKVYVRKAGTIKMANILCQSGTAGTAEAWSLYIRKNNSADTLIATLTLSAAERVFSNSSLDIAMAAGDYFEIKSVQPSWATNPLTTIYGGYVYIE